MISRKAQEMNIARLYRSDIDFGSGEWRLYSKYVHCVALMKKNKKCTNIW